MRIALALTILGLMSAAVAGGLIFIGNSDASQPCTWGASSIMVENGRVVAGPDVTGCVP